MPRPEGRLNPFRETLRRIVDLTWGPRARRASPQRLRFMVKRMRRSVVPICSHELCGASPRHFRGNLIGLRPDPFASAPPVLYHFRLGHGLSSELPALSSVVCRRAPGMHHLSSLIRHLPPPLSHLSSFIGHPSRLSPPLACHEDRGPGGLRPEDRGSFPNECDVPAPRFAILDSVGLRPGTFPLIR